LEFITRCIAKAYLPEFELISIVLFSSTVKVNGCSGKVLDLNSNFAGTATLFTGGIDS
jgi:hypothetical protein